MKLSCLAPTLLLLIVVQSQATEPSCEPIASFTRLSFESARLVRSNLGGLGGRCDADESPSECESGATAADTPREILIDGIGIASSGEEISLGIVNVSEYKAWNNVYNGIKHNGIGHYGVVNVLAPRRATSMPSELANWLEPHGTHVDLRYEFRSSRTGAPLTLERTFLTFYDLDTGKADAAAPDGTVARECWQLQSSDHPVRLPPVTTVEDFTERLAGHLGPASPWTTPVYCGTRYGIGRSCSHGAQGPVHP